MSKIEYYRQLLKDTISWEPYLLNESGLPGPRANLELLYAVALEGNRDFFLKYIDLDNDVAPVNSPEVFLVVCGIVGLGKLVAAGEKEFMSTLKKLANDVRWLVREAVAMALQLVGERDMDYLLAEMKLWCNGSLLEKRAVVAGLCEPKLLKKSQYAKLVLEILDDITQSLLYINDRKDENFKTLRQALAYCWSVAVVELSSEGKVMMEKWLANADKDVRWVMKENLKKNRLKKMDLLWVEKNLAGIL